MKGANEVAVGAVVKRKRKRLTTEHTTEAPSPTPTATATATSTQRKARGATPSPSRTLSPSPSHARRKSPSPRPLRREVAPPPILQKVEKNEKIVKEKKVVKRRKKVEIAAQPVRSATPSPSPSPVVSAEISADRAKRKVKRAHTATSFSAPSATRRPSPSPSPKRNHDASPSPLTASPRRRQDAFKRTSTMPSNRRIEEKTQGPSPLRARGGGSVDRRGEVESRLEVGLPIGIPSGLLPAAEMPPRDVLMDTLKRKQLLLRICDELEATMPLHLLRSDPVTQDEGKTAVKCRKRGAKSGTDIDEEEIDRRPVTSRFVRRVLVLFYASRNEAEESRVVLEQQMKQTGLQPMGWPDSIQCMHAAFLIVDSLVRIGHRRVLKVLFGTLFWHVLDVLEWPPQVYSNQIRLNHRNHVCKLQPDLSLTPASQREDLLRLHRVLYVQNSCLVKACDAVTYLSLHEYVEAEKLRLLRNVIDSGYHSSLGDCFVSKWADEWLTVPNTQHGIARKQALLNHLLSVTMSAWEHDKMTSYLKKLHSLSVTDILMEALCDRSTAAGAAEVLAILTSDSGAQEEALLIFLGSEHTERVSGWKKLILASVGEGSRGVREMIHSILTQTSELWDVMMYLQAVEDLVGGGLLQRNAEEVKNFCESWGLLVQALARVFSESYAGKVAALVVRELSLWIKGRFERDDAAMVASILKTISALLRAPCDEVALTVKQHQVFENLVGFIPTHNGLLQSSCLSLCRAVWWRSDSDDLDQQSPLHTSTDIGEYVESPSEHDPRASLIPPATYFLKKYSLFDMLQRVMHGPNTLCARKHPKAGVRTFFEHRTHYE